MEGLRAAQLRPGLDTPELVFAVEAVEAAPLAAVPTLHFRLRIEEVRSVAIRSVLLQTQIRVAVGRRPYDSATRQRLFELLGAPGQTSAPPSLLWAQSVIFVPGFTERTQAVLPVACTYDFDVAVAKYFHVVSDGGIPLDLLFSGTIFYADEGGALRTCLIPWESQAECELTGGTWHELMDHYFPSSAWLRLRRDVFDRLYSFKARHALPTWEDALEQLLTGHESAPAP